MMPERWQRIRALFTGALSLAPEEQASYLERECPDDPGLRAEVRNLLENEQRDGHFLEPGVPSDGPSSFAPGELVGGRFRIVRLLGRGGMGEVYEAEDILLSERVALKTIRPEIATDPKTLMRFRHEIQLARRITHANVCRIFDLQMHQKNGAPVAFLTMELLAGETLAARLERGGALPKEEALTLARQIAAGLAAAHQCGVVHRDFKSGNVMLVPGKEGAERAVIMDFGLAHDPGKHSRSHTLTASGKLMGTLDYMAPEQLETRKTSFRSDVYSLGLVLFEMVTGQLPFADLGPTVSLWRRLHARPPSPRTLRRELSRMWESVIAGCLERDPAKRFASAVEVATALAASPMPGQVHRYGRRAVLLTAGVGVILLALLALFFRTANHATPTVFQPTPLTSFPGVEFHPALSPDGKLVAFAWDGEKQDNVDIYIKQIASGALHRMTTDPAADISPAWSPDGEQIAFRRVLPQGVSQLIVVSYLGGAERKLAEWPYTPQVRLAGGLSNARVWRDLCWSPDGKWLIASGRSAPAGSHALFAISAESGETRQLTWPPPGDEGDACPALSPSGHTLAFARAAGALHSEIYVLPVSADLVPTGAARQITFGDRMAASPVWTADGDTLIFSAGAREDPRSLSRIGLFRIPVSGPAAFLPGAAPMPLLGTGDSAYQPTISRDGRRLAYAQILQDLNIWELRLPAKSGTSPTAVSLIASTRSDLLGEFSPDGMKIAFTSDRSGSYEVWICDRDGSHPVALTSLHTRFTGSPHWSPDGKQIAFVSHAGNQSQVYTIAANGGTPSRLTNLPDRPGAPTWSRDGQWIYFSYPQKGLMQVWKIPAQGGASVQVTKGGGAFALESVDGKYLFYSKTTGLQISVRQVPVEGGAETEILPAISLTRNFFVTARGIYFVARTGSGGTAMHNSPRGASIQFLSFATGATETVFTTEKPLSHGLAVSPDGHSLLYTQLDRTQSNLWLVDDYH